MFIKKKHLIVTTVSSVIILVVLFSTLIGYTLYIQWKKDSLALKYRNSIYKLTADLFSGDILLSNVKVSMEGQASSMVPVVRGSIRNNTEKTITSIQIEFSLERPDGTVLYKDWFHPLGEQPFRGPVLLPKKGSAGNALKSGEEMNFRHILRNCPRRLVSRLSRLGELARSSPEKDIAFTYKITGVGVI